MSKLENSAKIRRAAINLRSIIRRKKSHDPIIKYTTIAESFFQAHKCLWERRKQEIKANIDATERDLSVQEISQTTPRKKRKRSTNPIINEQERFEMIEIIQNIKMDAKEYQVLGKLYAAIQDRPNYRDLLELG